LSSQISEPSKIAGFRQAINQLLSFFKKPQDRLKNPANPMNCGLFEIPAADDLPTDDCGNVARAFGEVNQVQIMLIFSTASEPSYLFPYHIKYIT